ncbi:7403_t:CDS:2, partial [Gigaspora margarita]
EVEEKIRKYEIQNERKRSRKETIEERITVNRNSSKRKSKDGCRRKSGTPCVPDIKISV